jgi:hypothetical protein
MNCLAAVLLAETKMCARWPDGEVVFAWVLPAGAEVHIDDVSLSPTGRWQATVHQADARELFGVVELQALDLVGCPVPF